VERGRVGRYGPAKAVTPPHVDLNVEELSTRLRRVSPHANLVPAAFMDRMHPYNPEDFQDSSSASAVSDADGLTPQAEQSPRKKSKPHALKVPSGTATPRIVSKEAASLHAAELRAATAPVLFILGQEDADDLDEETQSISTLSTPPAAARAQSESRKQVEEASNGMEVPLETAQSKIVSLRMHRFAMTRGLRSRVRKMHEKMQKEFEDLPAETRDPLETAFSRCAVGNPPLLTAHGALRCAAELGIIGHCEDLHRKFWHLCADRAEETRRPVAGCDVAMVSIAAGQVWLGTGEAPETEPLQFREASGSSASTVSTPQAAAASKGISLIDFAMGLLPQMREEMYAQYSQDFQNQYTNIIGGDAPETFQIVAVLEIAIRLGFDRSHFSTAVESLRLDDEVRPLNAKLLSAVGATRSGRVPPAIAAQAAVICSGQVACATMQRACSINKSMDVKGWRRLHAGMGMPKLDISMPTDVVDLYDHFQSMAQDGTISSSEAFCILGSLGFMDIQAVHDASLPATAQSPSERHDLTSFIRQASFAEDRLRKQSTDSVTAIFKVRLQPGCTELPTSEVGHLLNDVGLLPNCHEEQVLIRDIVAELRARTRGAFDVLWFQSLCTAVEKCLLRARWDAMLDQVMAVSFDAKHATTASDGTGSLPRTALSSRMELKEKEKEVPLKPYPALVPTGCLPLTFSTSQSGGWLTPIIMRHALRWLQVPNKLSRCLRNEDLGPVLVKHLTLRKRNTEASWMKSLETELKIKSLGDLWNNARVVVEKAVQARELVLHSHG